MWYNTKINNNMNWNRKRLKDDTLFLIKDTIAVNRNGVINALKKSNVKVIPNITDKDLYQMVNDQLVNKENGYLVYHLGQVMKRVEATSGFEGYSSFNFEDLFPIGKALGLFGKKDAAAPQPTGTDPMMMQMQMAQQQAAAQEAARRREEQARRDREDARRRSNMMIFGIVGGIVVIGGVITAVIMMKKK